MAQIVEAVACTVCGCVCDDLRLTVDAGRIVRAERACTLAEPWFLAQNTQHRPEVQIHGRAATLADGVRRAADILRAARSPLIYGLSRSTTEGQRAAIALAEQIGAVIDTTAATGHAASLLAVQQVGESTCSLGEVKNRADLVIYWASDPMTTHPRHAERYAVEPVGMFLPHGRRDRTVVVVDQRPTVSSTLLADQFLPVEAGKDWEALWTLRMLLRGMEPTKGSESGAPLDGLRALAQRMRASRFGVIFFGVGLTRGGLGHRNVEALLQLVTDLNDGRRFYARRMRRWGDVAGADSVLTWQTGYPFAVQFAAGYPRYNPGEFSGPEMLARGEVDACLLVGSETITDFPPQAIDQLRRIPVIVLESPETETWLPTAVWFTTAVYGIHRPGTAYRMDEVPIPLRVVLPIHYPSDGEVLEQIRLACQEQPAT